MAFFDFFVSEQEKSYRRMELINKFIDSVESYCDSEENLEFFINPERKEAKIFIFHSDSPRTYGIGGEKYGSINITSMRHKNKIYLSDLTSMVKLKKEYGELKKQNIHWEKIFEDLSDSIVDLLVEAVAEFERKYSLPKRW